MTRHILVILVVTLALVSLCSVVSETKETEPREWSKATVRGGTEETAQPAPSEPQEIIRRSTRIVSPLSIASDSPDIAIISGSNNAQSENSVFIDPMNPLRVLNSNNSQPWPTGEFYGADYWVSNDGGQTWTGSVQGAGGVNSGDPATGINRDGRMFVNFITTGYGQGIAFSDDGGANWSSVQIAPGPWLLDKNHMWVDDSPSSPYGGNLYVAWTNLQGGATDGQIELSRSTDDGLAWSGPVNLSGAIQAGSHNQGVNIQTGPNGEVYVVWAVYDAWPADETALGFARSTDGGATWSPGTRILTGIRGHRTTPLGGGKTMRHNSFPSMSVNQQTGEIYVVWTNIGVPGVNTGDPDVYLIKSADGGNSWSSPQRVNQDPVGNGKDQWFPWISCDPTTGLLACAFYDSRAFSGNDMAETWVALSLDGATTWEDFRVSDVAWSGDGFSGSYAGDYIAIASRDNQVYPVWSDNRAGNMLAYASPFTVATGPVVCSVTPPPNAVSSSEALLTVDFCEDMDPLTLGASSIVVRGSVTGAIPGTIYPNGATAYFVPTNPFPKNEAITATVGSSVETADGSPEFNGYSWTFTTGGCSQGVFRPETDYPTSPEPIYLVTADFNDDGFPDVITASVSSYNTVSLLLNDGSGAFPARTDLNLGTNQGPSGMSTGDFDGDGDIDLGLICWGTDTFVLMANDGSGAFTLAQAHSVTDIHGGSDMADMDADGDLDFVISVGGTTDAVEILFNSGNGALSGTTILPAPNNPGPLKVVDVNNDGAPDIVVGNPTGGTFSVFLNDGEADPGFTRADYSSVDPRDLAVADFDGDGYADVATHDSSYEEVDLFMNDGAGSFTAGSVLTPVSGWAITPGDLDSDGDMDLATATHSATALTWIENEGNGVYTIHQSGTSRSGTDLVAANVNDDASLDVIVVDQVATDNSISVVLNLGPPAAPDLVSPADGQTVTAPASPLLDCEDAPTALYYQFQIDDDPNFGSPVSSYIFLPTSEWTVTPELSVGTYYWRAAAANACGYGPWSSSRTLVVHSSGGGGGCAKLCYEESGLSTGRIPTETRILLARPNPFNGRAEIHWAMKQPSDVAIRVFDIQGRLLLGEDFPGVAAGVWEWTWDGTDETNGRVARGVYFVKLVTDHAVDTVRLVRLD